ncbi:hypothetical protein HGRIS_010938 [Hohenbuehelia grisea]|uniref:Uncharacterized protein n=1 Tax=Hohenbuehelia grisea TaxID=104357 RepID=A0ABR3IYK6_9AGAR
MAATREPCTSERTSVAEGRQVARMANPGGSTNPPSDGDETRGYASTSDEGDEASAGLCVAKDAVQTTMARRRDAVGRRAGGQMLVSPRRAFCVGFRRRERPRGPAIEAWDGQYSPIGTHNSPNSHIPLQGRHRHSDEPPPHRNCTSGPAPAPLTLPGQCTRSSHWRSSVVVGCVVAFAADVDARRPCISRVARRGRVVVATWPRTCRYPVKRSRSKWPRFCVVAKPMSRPKSRSSSGKVVSTAMEHLNGVLAITSRPRKIPSSLATHRIGFSWSAVDAMGGRSMTNASRRSTGKFELGGEIWRYWLVIGGRIASSKKKAPLAFAPEMSCL